jgi:hypothetical protein
MVNGLFGQISQSTEQRGLCDEDPDGEGREVQLRAGLLTLLAPNR